MLSGATSCIAAAPGFGRRRRVDHGRQHAVVDLDLLGRVPRLRVGVGDDDGDVIADIAHLALREHRMGAGLHRRAVLGMDLPAADEAADLVRGDVGAGEHRHHAGRAVRRGGVDLVDRRVRVRRAQEIGVGLAGTVDVVDVVALAGDEADIFLALDGGADAVALMMSLPELALIASRVIRRPWRRGAPSRARPARSP